MRLLAVMFVIACSGASSKPAGPASRTDLGCTPQPGFDEAACAARGPGCSYQPRVECYGDNPGDDILEAERQELVAGRLPCDCKCEAWCPKVPSSGD